MNGLKSLHSVHVVHQDVKPSNILVFSDGTVKIADLGIGHSFESAATIVGSPAYQAPEVFFDDEYEWSKYDPTKGDVWSVGVALYEVCFKCLPFEGSDIYEIARNTVETELKIPESAPTELKDLLSKLLIIDPEKRISIEEASQHPFLACENKKIDFTSYACTFPYPKLDLPTKEIKAIICGNDYQFYNHSSPCSMPADYRAFSAQINITFF